MVDSERLRMPAVSHTVTLLVAHRTTNSPRSAVGKRRRGMTCFPRTDLVNLHTLGKCILGVEKRERERGGGWAIKTVLPARKYP